MKVLIETITNRKGYKLFEGIDEFNDFLLANRPKITKFQIIEEDNDAINQMLQSYIDDAKSLERKIYYTYFQKLAEQPQYLNLLGAIGHLIDVTNDIKSCMK